MLYALCCVVAFNRSVVAQEQFEFFESRIRPVLVAHCYECHSAAAAEIKGGLRLDSRPAMREGGDSGPAIVPGDPNNSLLLAAIKHESLEMPPDESLSKEVIQDFERWIRRGALDPRQQAPTTAEATAISWAATLQSRRDWWSLQPLQDPRPPYAASHNWSDHAIDAFVARRLRQVGLRPTNRAEPRTLARRLSLTLTGMAPTPEALDTFLKDWSRGPDRAWQQLVETLLASPHFGERWARHWMDVVRFTETHGNEWNYEVHHAWQYRDYLVRAFNADVPYDQFVREHIAGDLLHNPRRNPDRDFNESVIGTAFYRFGEVNHDDCITLTTIGYDILANQIDTLTKAFQGSTVACARCHDHKIDAFSMGDYHSLLGILRSSRLVAHAIDAPNLNRAALHKLESLKPEIRAKLVDLWTADVGSLAANLLSAQQQQAQIESANCDERSETTKPAATDGQHDADSSVELEKSIAQRWQEAISISDLPLAHPLHVWQKVANREAKSAIHDVWQTLAQHYDSERTRRKQHNETHYEVLYDLREGPSGWTYSGHGLANSTATDGELVFHPRGSQVVQGVLPKGIYTHRLTQNLGGALRSPILHPAKKHISLRVLGGERAAARIVSNNCQLNYANYKVLLSDQMGWITFTPPTDQEQMRPYIEVLTKFYNPKFPDQLGTLGGDKQNDRVPWDEVARNPRSFFGISHVVAHDTDGPPLEDVDYLCRLFDSETVPTTLAEVAGQYQRVITAAMTAWAAGRANETDLHWVDWLVRNKLITNSISADDRLRQLVQRYRHIEASEIRRPRIIPGVEDADRAINQSILVRGDPTNFGAATPRRFFEVLDPMRTPYRQGSGRLELANDIARPDNPLTARVMANRVWHHLFGTGLVRTADDFGRLGEVPSHPELLDHLAAKFVEGSWSLKRLIHYVVTSGTFQLDSRITPEAYEIDPLNKLLHHYPTRRMEAEAIRDNILTAFSALDPSLGGQSIYPYRETPNELRRLFVGPLDGHRRRSIYIKTNLMEPTRFLSSFNTPGGKITTGRRESSQVPAQALALLNDPFVLEQSDKWARQLVTDAVQTPRQRVNAMLLATLSRDGADGELQHFGQLISELSKLYDTPPDAIMRSVPIWKDVAHVMFNLKEFIYIP